MNTENPELTRILTAWQEGQDDAGEALMDAVYAEFRRMAVGYLRNERQGHTLQPTALVHEAYLRLLGHEEIRWQNRSQFFGVAARTMRRILVDHARARDSKKRGGEFVHVGLEETDNQSDDKAAEILALDAALVELEKMDPENARIVEMRYFGGFEVREIAQLLGVSVPTVNRRWRMARAWLAAELQAA